MFAATKQTAASRGNLLMLLAHPRRLRRYVSVILIGVPIWYVIALLIVLAPEVGEALGMPERPSAGRAILFAYSGLVFGDLGSGVLSQVFRTRKKIVGAFLLLTAACIAIYFTVGPASLTTFYTCCFLLGVSTGYWAVFMTVASEQFGTNIRATVTTTAPNFVRGSVPLVTMLFRALKEHMGLVGAAATVGALTLAIAFIALLALDETYGKDLDYIET